MNQRLISILLTILSLPGISQDQTNFAIDLLPSPEAASLGQFVSVPVSHYTGVPDINIPLFQLHGKEMSLPIALKYHSNGNKVADRASFVGLGWALEAGGVLSRVVRGLPDEHENGIFSTTASRYFNQFSDLHCDDNNPESRLHLDSVASGKIDIASDLFFYSLPTESGKFTYKRNSLASASAPFGTNSPLLIPIKATDISYEVEPNPINGNPIRAFNWKVATADGTIYEFEHSDADLSHARSLCGFAVNNEYTVQNTWHLSRIISPNRIDIITFSYVPEYINYRQKGPLIEARRESGKSISTCISEISLQQARLASIRTSWGDEVKFIAETDRLDFPGAKALDKVEYYYQGHLKSSYELNKDYFDATIDLDSDYDYNNKKLKLESVRQVAPNGVKLPPYQLIYRQGSFPSYSSYAVDHWGYFNGEQNTGYERLPAVDYEDKYFEGAERTPSLNHTLSGVLKKMVYPTGGAANFSYQLHDYYDDRKVQTGSDGTTTYVAEWFEESVSTTVTSQSTNCTSSSAVSKTLTVQPINGQTQVDAIITHENPCEGNSNCSNLQGITFEHSITRTDGSPIDFSYTNGSNHVKVDPGQYRILVKMCNTSGSGIGGSSPDYTGMTHSLTFKYKQFVLQGTTGTPGNNQTRSNAGGLRISKIALSPELCEGKPVNRYYSYSKPGTYESSGKLMAEPFYMYETKENNTCSEFDPGDPKEVIFRSSNSGIPLNFVQGSSVGYNVVTEYSSNEALVFDRPAGGILIGQSGVAPGGKTEYHFINELPAENNSYPFISSFPDLFKNGRLKQKIDSKWISDQEVWKKTSQTINKYSYTNTSENANYVMAKVSSSSCENCHGLEYNTNIFRDKTAQIRLDNTTETTYDDADIPFSIKKEFFYNTVNDLPTTTKIQSGGKTYTEQSKFHFNFNPGDTAIDYLASTGQKNRLVEKIVTVGMSGLQTQKTISSYVQSPNRFTEEFNSVGKKYSYDPVVDQNDYSSLLVSGSSLTMDNNMYENASLKLDAFGNPIEVRQIGDRKNSYLWGYNYNKQVADVLMAGPEDIAFSSFDDFVLENRDDSRASGNWVIQQNSCASNYTDLASYLSCLEQSDLSIQSYSGTYALNGSVRAYIQTFGQYTISFKAKNTGNVTINGVSYPANGNWKMTTINLSLSSTSVLFDANNLSVDNLRLYPTPASMTTYCYDELGRLTSSDDTSGNTTFYSYDEFDRLTTVNDFDGNLVQTIDYKYSLDEN